MLPCCPGTIQQYLGDLSYIVEDATGYIERIWREDIISDYDDNAPPLKVSTKNVLPLSISFFVFVRGGGGSGRRRRGSLKVEFCPQDTVSSL